jgi:uncharacterized protein YqgC (DUF456 family)
VGGGEVEVRPSFYSAGIGTIETICLAAGIGISIGMVAGTTGVEGSARGRMTVLAAVIGLIFGYFAASVFDGALLPALISCALFAGLACAVMSGVIAGARRRGGTAALTFIVILIAIVVALVTVLFPPFAILPAGVLLWLAISRNRRSDRKHAGLRVLR